MSGARGIGYGLPGMARGSGFAERWASAASVGTSSPRNASAGTAWASRSAASGAVSGRVEWRYLAGNPEDPPTPDETRTQANAPPAPVVDQPLHAGQLGRCLSRTELMTAC